MLSRQTKTPDPLSSPTHYLLIIFSAPTQIRRNQTYFVNFVWDVSKAVQLGLEVDYRKTDYTQFQPNAFLDSDAVVIASRFLWRF